MRQPRGAVLQLGFEGVLVRGREGGGEEEGDEFGEGVGGGGAVGGDAVGFERGDGDAVEEGVEVGARLE